MNPLDDDRLRRRVDKDDVLRAFRLLPDQAACAWRESSNLKLGGFRGFDRIVVSGMGGSALGPHLIKSVFRDELRLPFEIVNGYKLPAGVGSKTLVILSSYSGTTEETLNTAKEAAARNAKIVGICRGGALARFLKKRRAPAYIFDPRNNPGDRPRLALGYSIFGLLGLLSAVKILPVKNDLIAAAILELRRAVNKYDPEVPFAKNPAKKLAEALKDSIAVYVGAEHLEGSAHILANQTNETGKQFATWFPLPELNHHLMEGLGHPVLGKKSLDFVFLNSKLYSPRLRERFALTREVVSKNKVRVHEFAGSGKNQLAEAMHVLVFGGALTYFLGILHRENPSPNPWVDYFKRRLSNEPGGV
jgi:glucose/mannose-6-phosphate isomerase